MMKRFILGDFQTNCYIVDHNHEAIIIDPGDNGKKINKYLVEQGIKLSAILITHGHIDHIGAVEYLYNIYHCEVYAHEETIEVVKDATFNLSGVFGDPYILNVPIIPVHDLEILHLIGYTIKWYFMPGHCSGSSMIYLEDLNMMFSGDVLFQGSIGRYDFPSSSHYDTKVTLSKIKNFDFDCMILPGHGEASSLNQEKISNPYLK